MVFLLERNCHCCMEMIRIGLDITKARQHRHCKSCWENFHCDERKGLKCDFS